MLSRVRLIRPDGEELSLSLRNHDNGYTILNMDGLTPVPATMSESPFAQRDGSHYHASRREPRDVKIRIGLEASSSVGTVRHLRTQLYAYLMPGAEIRLRLVTMDGGSYDILGRVETFEAPIFVSDAVAEVSIRCFDPDFFFTGWTNKTLTSTAGAWPNPITYEGTVRTGFLITGPIPRALSGITFANNHPSIGVHSFVLDYDFQEGDHLTLNTNPGERSILLKRGGINRSILRGLSRSSKWLYLYPGMNYIRFFVAGTPEIELNLGYKTKFGGL